MIARITIIMALLSIANCVGKRTIEFRVEKKYGFLHIFKYIGYSLYVKEGETAETSDPKKCTSDWYFWSGYQEKFKDGTYKISLITQVNAEEEKAPIEVQLEAKGDLILLAKNVPIDSRCTVSKEFDYRVEDKGWNKNVKNLKLLLTCKVAEGEKIPSGIITEVEEEVQIETKKSKLPEENLLNGQPNLNQGDNTIQTLTTEIKPKSTVVQEVEKLADGQANFVLEQPVEVINKNSQPIVEEEQNQTLVKKSSKIVQEERIIL